MVFQLIPRGTAAYIVTCDFNENPKSDFDFDFDLGFVNMLSEKNIFDNILLVICRYDLKKININVVLVVLTHTNNFTFMSCDLEFRF